MALLGDNKKRRQIMNNFKEHLVIFLRAILAGICIGIGGAAYLLCSSKVVGAFVFPIGLVTILIFGFNLYTGMIGYLFDRKPSYIIDLVLAWIGNLVGSVLIALMLGYTRIGDNLRQAALSVSEAKIADDFISLFILGLFCGILVFISVDVYKRNAEKKDFMIIFIVFVAIGTFILCGFEHCVADMFYFAAAGRLFDGMLALLAITLGNSVGGLMIPVIRRLYEKKA